MAPLIHSLKQCQPSGLTIQGVAQPEPNISTTNTQPTHVFPQSANVFPPPVPFFSVSHTGQPWPMLVLCQPYTYTNTDSLPTMPPDVTTYPAPAAPTTFRRRHSTPTTHRLRYAPYRWLPSISLGTTLGPVRKVRDVTPDWFDTTGWDPVLVKPLARTYPAFDLLDPPDMAISSAPSDINNPSGEQLFVYPDFDTLNCHDHDATAIAMASVPASATNLSGGKPFIYLEFYVLNLAPCNTTGIASVPATGVSDLRTGKGPDTTRSTSQPGSAATPALIDSSQQGGRPCRSRVFRAFMSPHTCL
jgi:hypothetical protein